MNEYIFYTTEGLTEAPNENFDVENCQVLGRAFGKDESEAQKKLLSDNQWITEAGFDPSEFIAKQILTDEQRVYIKHLLDYLWKDEERHYEECEDKSNHIFNVMQELKKIC